MKNLIKIDRKTKIRAGVSITIGTCSEIAIILPLILYSKNLSLSTWSVIGGPTGIIAGIVFVYNFWYIPFPKQSYILKLSIMTNPGISMILAGITLLLTNFPKYEFFFFLCGFLTIIFFFIGLVCFYVHLVKSETFQRISEEGKEKNNDKAFQQV